jgi:hypothetical protein
LQLCWPSACVTPTSPIPPASRQAMHDRSMDGILFRFAPLQINS